MGYKGTVNLQEYLAKKAPKHPFASLQIGFGVKPPPSSSSASQTPQAEGSSTSQSQPVPAADSTPTA